MDEQHHRSRPSGHGVARLGEVTDQLQTVARRHDDRPHWHQRRAFERRPAREQPTHPPAGAVVVEEAPRRAGRFGIAHPARTVVGHAEPAELALARADDPLEIGRGGLIDHLPAPFAVDRPARRSARSSPDREPARRNRPAHPRPGRGICRWQGPAPPRRPDRGLGYRASRVPCRRRRSRPSRWCRHPPTRRGGTANPLPHRPA